VSRGGYAEASSLIAAALKLLDKVPDSNERMRAELALRSIEAAIAHVLYGAPSPEREHAIRRMYELGERIGEVDQFLRGLLALCQLYFVRGEPIRGFDLAKRCVELAEATQEAWLLAYAHNHYALLACSSGKLRDSISHLEDATLHSSRMDRKVSPLDFLYTSSVTNA